MVTAKEIDRQLKKLGVSFWFFGNAEIRELQHIIVEGEEIQHCILGRYESGFAVLCATSFRVLLIDKKPFYLTLEDVRYDMIVEVDFGRRLLEAYITICTPNKTLRFTSMKKPQLRQMVVFIQHQVMVFRQQHVMQPQQAPVQPVEFVSTSAPAPLQPSWQPQALIEQPVTARRSLKSVAHTAINGATRVVEARPIAAFRGAVNPYARSSLIMRQRISRF